MQTFRAAAACIVFFATVPAVAADDTASEGHPTHRSRHHRAAAGGSEAPDAEHRSGTASFYSRHFTGKKTASGERYDPEALTAAHRTLPLGTRVKVVNPKNDRSVVVTVNDRGPVHGNRMIDVSSAAADKLGMKKSGVTKVRTEVLDRPREAKRDPAKPDEAKPDEANAGPGTH